MNSNSNLKSRWPYEYTVVLIHWFIFGFVALDRNLITFVFPLMLPELKMSFTEAGLALSALGITWAAGTLIFGGLSDRFGRKAVIIPATILFSVMSWGTGIVQSFAQLLGARAVMGLPEGAYYSTASATIAEVSTPERRGLNLGIHQSSWAIVGMLLGPIYATAIASAWGWRWALYLTVIPGIIIAVAHWRFVHEPPSTEAAIKARKEGRPHEVKSHTGETMNWKQVFGYRNVIISSLLAIAIMTWLFTFLAFGTLFVSVYRKIPLLDTGFVMSMFGIGGFIGFVGLPGVSDLIGRRPTLTAAGILAAISTFSMAYVGADPVALGISIFFMGMFGFGVFTQAVAVVPAESVPFALAGIAVGIPVCIGEFFGASIMPTIGGMIADAYGLQAAMMVAGVGALVVAILAPALKETAPRIVARRAARTAQAEAA